MHLHLQKYSIAYLYLKLKYKSPFLVAIIIISVVVIFYLYALAIIISEDVLKDLVTSCSQPKEVLLYQFYERKRSSTESISKYALALQELLAFAVPTMNLAEQTILLRAQSCLSVPEHMRALIQFNSSLSWDALLVCLDKSLPHVMAHEAQQQQQQFYPRSQHQALPLIKTEPIEATWVD